MKKPLYVIRNKEAKLHMSKGNSKIGKGIWSFSTLPGNKDHMLVLSSGALLTDIPGTCSRFCNGCAKDGACYAWRDAKLHNNVTIRAWGENTLLLRNGKLFSEVEKFITTKNKKYNKTKNPDDTVLKILRIHVSGEIEETDHLRKWNDIAKNHPEVIFGIYTKNYDALEEFLEKDSFADNFIVNVSQWNHVADEFLAAHKDAKLNVFTYDDGNKKTPDTDVDEIKRLSKVVHCPAVMKNGKHAKDAAGNPITCDHCRRCYTKTGKETAVWSH